MSFPYKKTVVIGATSGIGQSLANRLVSQGVYVIAVGRRQDRLDEFVARAGGSSKASNARFDLAEVDEVPKFAERLLKQHPDIDCIILNAGVQYVMDFSKPKTVDIGKIQHEITVNYTSLVALTHAIMPFFQRKGAPESAFIYTTSGLESIPYPMVLNYCATKAALKSFILSVRAQLNESKIDSIKLIELYPPLVQTELHDKQPGWTENRGMPLEDFVTGAIEGFASKSETVAVGDMAKGQFDEFEAAKGPRTAKNFEMARKMFGSAHQLE